MKRTAIEAFNETIKIFEEQCTHKSDTAKNTLSDFAEREMRKKLNGRLSSHVSF